MVQLRAEGLGVLVGLVLLVPLGGEAQQVATSRTPLQQLAAALGPCRPSPGRLTLELGHTPEVTACLPGAGDAAMLEVVDAVARMERRARGAVGGLDDAEAGVLALLQGRAEVAATRLEAARGGADDGGDVATNLSAAHLALAAGGDARHLVLALDAADAACAGRGNTAAARFNLALSLTRLGLHHQARAAWASFLAIEHDPAWAEEARGHLAALQAAGGPRRWAALRAQLQSLPETVESLAGDIAGHSSSVRLLLLDELLPRWAAAGPGAGRSLDTTRAVSRVLERTGDASLIDLVTEIDEAVLANDAAHLDRLRKGLAGWARARERYTHADHEAALPLFAAVAETAPAASLLSSWAHVYAAICRYHLPDREAAAAELLGLGATVDSERHPVLAGLIGWMLGLIDYVAGRPEPAVAHFEAALAAFTRAGDAESTSNMHSLLASAHDLLRDRDAAWRHRSAALAASAWVQQPRRRHNLLSYAADAMSEAGLVRAALHLDDELVALSRTGDDPLLLAVALWQRSRRLVATGRLQRAAEDLDEAARHARGIPGEGARQTVQLDLAITRATVLRHSDAGSALTTLDQALDAARRLDDHNRQLAVLRLRASVHLDRGHAGPAEADLATAIAELEQRRTAIEGSDRAAYFEQAQGVFGDMIALLAEQGRAVEAMGFNERRLARSLLESVLGDRSAVPLGAREVASRLPTKTRAVSFFLGERHALAWVAGGGRVHQCTLPLSSAAIEALARRMARAAAQGDVEAELHDAGAGLYQALVTPVAPCLDDGDSLVVVPDAALHPVPFSALVNPRTGAFLVEERQIATAPSASVLVRASEHDCELAGRRTAVLVAGMVDPEPDRLARLAPLPAAAAELEQVAELHPGAHRLTGAGATPEGFLGAAATATVIHYAGHAVLDPYQPERSALVLAASASSPDGLLTAGRIAAARLDQTRLVVLSACRGADGPLTPGEGADSLARAFLATGVPAVVAGLWPVDDAATAELMTRFHRHWRRTGDACLALRTAQLELVNHPDRLLAAPRSWAAMQLIGGTCAPVTTLEPDTGGTP